MEALRCLAQRSTWRAVLHAPYSHRGFPNDVLVRFAALQAAQSRHVLMPERAKTWRMHCWDRDRRSYHVVSVEPKLSLSDLQPNPGARKPRKKKGRGHRGFRGRKCGVGMKGQKARSGGGIPFWFMGGTTPLYRLFPKIKRQVSQRKPLDVISLKNIQHFIDKGRLDPSKTITLRDLWKCGATGTAPQRGVYLAAYGAEYLRTPIDIQAQESSERAADAILKRGGKLTLVYYGRIPLQAHLRPEKWTDKGMPLPRNARPKPRFAEFYNDRNEQGEYIRRINSPEDVIYKKPEIGKLAEKVIWPEDLVSPMPYEEYKKSKAESS